MSPPKPTMDTIELPAWIDSYKAASGPGLRGFPSSASTEAVGLAFLRGLDLMATETSNSGATEQKAATLHDTKAGFAACQRGSEDYYELLGLSKHRQKATVEDFRLAYRDLCLVVHPDVLKSQADDDEENDAMFKAVTFAYETLIDPRRKLIFDSKIGPNVKVPGPDADFFKAYSEAFKRAGYWSVTKPVPELGDDSTPDDVVDKFYEWWVNFESWRDWSFAGEHDISRADGRDERRHMEKENERTAAKKKREEMAKIHQMVENAMKADPRLRRRREKERMERERVKEEAERKVREAEEEKKRAAESAATAAADAARLAKNEKERVKREGRRQRKRLRDTLIEKYPAFDVEIAEPTAGRLHPDELSPIVDALALGDTAPLLAAMAETRKQAGQAAHESAVLAPLMPSASA